MTNVILANGEIVESYFVTKQAPPAQIHIYPKNLTISKIYELFDDDEATSTIIVETEAVDKNSGESYTERTTYNGYTELFSVQRSFYHPDMREYMIWLQRPEET